MHVNCTPHVLLKCGPMLAEPRLSFDMPILIAPLPALRESPPHLLFCWSLNVVTGGESVTTGRDGRVAGTHLALLGRKPLKVILSVFVPLQAEEGAQQGRLCHAAVTAGSAACAAAV